MSKNNDFELQKPLHKRAKTVLFDLDGTIADDMKYEKHHKHRNEDFAKEALDVPVKEDIVEKMHKAKANGENIVILTARSAYYRPETKKWLHKNHIPYDALIMRPTDDLTEKDKKVKKELLEEDILPKFDVKKAYDDKKKNIKMFEKLGIEAKKVK
jgi:histidinol phosphatase-like enzyme